MTDYRVKQFNAILELCAALAGEGATRKQIAEALGLKKSPNVITLVKYLVSENYLVEQIDQTQYPHRFKYRVADRN